MVKSTTIYILVAISVILFALNGFSFTKIYNTRQNINESILAECDGKLKTSMSVSVAKPPALTAFIADGGEKTRAPAYGFFLYGNVVPYPVDTNSILSFIPVFDWIFIIKIIFSIYVFLLIFNAISGERESGTLRQVLANPVNRSKVLFVKYLSGCIGFIIPLVIGMTISIIIVAVSIPEALTGKIFFSVALFFSITFLFLSALVLIGLFVSSIVRRSSIVLILLFSFWVGMLITPNLSQLLANSVVNVMRDYEVARENELISEEYSVNVIFRRIKNNEFGTIEEVQEAGDKILADRTRLRDKLRNDRKNSLQRRLILTRKLALISPMTVMQYASEVIAGTGYEYHNWYIRKIEQQLPVFRQYSFNKTSYKPEDFIAHGSNIVSFNGEMITIGKWPPQIKNDFNDSPIIETPTYSIIAGSAMLLRYVIILLLWNLILAMGSFLAFNRADVR